MSKTFKISNIEHIFGISMIGSETAGMWQMFKGVIKSWKKLGRFPSHSFITFAFATLPPPLACTEFYVVHDTSGATSPSVFLKRM